MSLLNLDPDPFFTVSKYISSETAAVKANFNSLLEAQIDLSCQITCPDNLMRRSEKPGAAATDGWSWTSTWSSCEYFEGGFNNGAHDSLKTDLRDTKNLLQNAISFVFPTDTHGTTNTALTEQLGLSYDQAVAWLESLTPLFKTMMTGGLSYAEAWS